MRVERVYAPDVLTVRAVSEQLVQVFVNLITNACQAAPPSDGRLIVHDVAGDRPRAGRRPSSSSSRTTGRHRGGAPRPRLRAVLHDEGREERHGPRAVDREEHRRGSRRRNPRREPAGRGTRFILELPEPLPDRTRRVEPGRRARPVPVPVPVPVPGRCNQEHGYRFCLSTWVTATTFTHPRSSRPTLGTGTGTGTGGDGIRTAPGLWG